MVATQHSGKSRKDVGGFLQEGEGFGERGVKGSDERMVASNPEVCWRSGRASGPLYSITGKAAQAWGEK